MTRRHALQRGAAVVGGLAVGASTVGTVGGATAARARIVGEHHFVRAAGDTEPSQVPDPQDRLVERRFGNPVDDGTDPDKLDGTHQLRWGEFRAVNGHVTLECNADGSTDVRVTATGLVPNKRYTMWVIVFHEPGFHFESRAVMPFGTPGTAGEHVLGAGPLGPQDGSENGLEVRGSRGDLTATHPAGEELAIAGPDGPYTVEGCLLDEYEVHLVGDYHLDGQTHGPVPGAPGVHVEHFGAVFVDGMPM